LANLHCAKDHRVTFLTSSRRFLLLDHRQWSFWKFSNFWHFLRSHLDPIYRLSSNLPFVNVWRFAKMRMAFNCIIKMFCLRCDHKLFPCPNIYLIWMKSSSLWLFHPHFHFPTLAGKFLCVLVINSALYVHFKWNEGTQTCARYQRISSQIDSLFWNEYRIGKDFTCI